MPWVTCSDEEVKKRRSALEKKEAEADQKHAEQLTVRHANDKARIDAQVEREMATTRLAHIKAEQEFVARRSYYQVRLALAAYPTYHSSCGMS